MSVKSVTSFVDLSNERYLDLIISLLIRSAKITPVYIRNNDIFGPTKHANYDRYVDHNMNACKLYKKKIGVVDTATIKGEAFNAIQSQRV